MKCDNCNHDVHRLRIINEKSICHYCGSKYGLFHVKHRVSRLLSGNPFNPKETEAYKEDLESRYIPSGSQEYDRWVPGRKTFI